MTLSIPAEALALRAKLFRGLADPSRLAILEALRDGTRTVSELVEATSLSQPNVSNHLSCLRACGLVAATQEGRYVHYQLSDDRVAALMGLADELVAEVARGVYECTRYTSGVARETEAPQ
ncbi:MAG TPA: metalloregulator ArsR/SmtB family transcription factor [Roseiflexaceae bacterium]|nr:metalloregulator ArsR/SmtB family transcription factor [Roseiflexaceae bacterium]